MVRWRPLLLQHVPPPCPKLAALYSPRGARVSAANASEALCAQLHAAVTEEPRFETAPRERLGVQVALRLVPAFAQEIIELRPILYALAYARHVAGTRERADRREQAAALAVRGKPARAAPVDLERID